MKFEIKNRFSGEVQITAEIECASDASPRVRLGLAIKWAVAQRADLRSADLSGADLRSADLRSADLRSADLRSADLSGADLRSADLSGADLRSADLRSADLRSADLRSADLRSADLSGADLRSADLRSADLSGADLRSADLSGADLSGADLSGADLRSADLRSADLRQFKADLWMTLTQNRAEVPALIVALRDGKVNGSTYEGPCACLVGTIAKVRGVSYNNLDHNARNPAEQWFAPIRPGNKPDGEGEGSYRARLAIEWATEWCALNGVAVEA